MNISFSNRMSNIVALTDALTLSAGDATKAREEAQALEANLYSSAISEEDYEALCDGLITLKSSLTMQIPVEILSQPEADHEVLSPEGPAFGDYVQATFHRDGQMSTIFKARSVKSGAPYPIVALKVTTPSLIEPPHNSWREARLLLAARHKHVVPLIESFTQSAGRLVLVFPFMRHDLEFLLRSSVVSQEVTGMVVKGLFEALQHIHALGMIHRDVKPANILLQSLEGPIYIADFGIAWSLGDPESEAEDMKITDVGTTSYRPPELLFGCRDYNASLDMWAAGCVVAEMVKGDHRPLFDAGPLGSELGLIKSIFQTLGTPTARTWPSAIRLPDWGKMRFQDFAEKSWHDILPGVTADAVDLVRRTVAYEGAARLTAADALKHAFVFRDS